MPKPSSNRGLVLVTGGPGYIAGEGYGEVYGPHVESLTLVNPD
jgi:hypothetical protein